MKIVDLLTIAGDVRVKSYGWGVGVVATLNRLFQDAQKVTTEVTGNELLAIVRTYPEDAANAMLEIDVDSGTGREEGEDPESTIQKRHRAPMIVVGFTTFIALVFTGAIAFVSVSSGTGPEAGAMQVILEAMVAVFKAMLGAG